MHLWVNELWLLGTALVFTWLGFKLSKWNVEDITERVIDSLIEQGYLKAEGEGKFLTIIKWREWCDDCKD
jgi:hypothetical protein